MIFKLIANYVEMKMIASKEDKKAFARREFIKALRIALDASIELNKELDEINRILEDAHAMPLAA